jgi:antitoxin Phd
VSNTWQLQKAKAEFSKLIEQSIRNGPQTVTRHGRPAAVVLSAVDYKKLATPKRDFKSFLRCPALGDVDLRRSGDRGRPVNL